MSQQQFIPLTADQFPPQDEGQHGHAHARRGSTHEPLCGTTPTQDEPQKSVEFDAVQASNDRVSASKPTVDRLV
jgi:hypothetical protein